MPVVEEEEEVVACQGGWDQGNVRLEDRGKLEWECEVRETKELRKWKQDKCLLTLLYLPWKVLRSEVM